MLSSDKNQQTEIIQINPKNKTGICYDKKMELHHDTEFHVENPERTKTILSAFQKKKLDKLCVQIPSKKATLEELERVHTKDHVKGVLSIKSEKSKPDIWYDTDIFYNKFTKDAVLLSAGCVVQLVDKVMTGEITNGFSFSRPPGHHSESAKAQ